MGASGLALTPPAVFIYGLKFNVAVMYAEIIIGFIIYFIFNVCTKNICWVNIKNNTKIGECVKCRHFFTMNITRNLRMLHA